MVTPYSRDSRNRVWEMRPRTIGPGNFRGNLFVKDLAQRGHLGHYAGHGADRVNTVSR